MKKFEQMVSVLTTELRSGFGLLSVKIDQTNQKLDQTNERIGRLETSTSTKLDGIGIYLKSINGSVKKHADDINDLKVRVKKLEKRDNGPDK